MIKYTNYLINSTPLRSVDDQIIDEKCRSVLNAEVFEYMCSFSDFFYFPNYPMHNQPISVRHTNSDNYFNQFSYSSLDEREAFKKQLATIDSESLFFANGRKGFWFKKAPFLIDSLYQFGMTSPVCGYFTAHRGSICIHPGRRRLSAWAFLNKEYFPMLLQVAKRLSAQILRPLQSLKFCKISSVEKLVKLYKDDRIYFRLTDTVEQSLELPILNETFFYGDSMKIGNGGLSNWERFNNNGLFNERLKSFLTGLDVYCENETVEKSVIHQAKVLGQKVQFDLAENNDEFMLKINFFRTNKKEKIKTSRPSVVLEERVDFCVFKSVLFFSSELSEIYISNNTGHKLIL